MNSYSDSACNTEGAIAAARGHPVGQIRNAEMRQDVRATLMAAFGRILPDDESGPGANEAGAITFVEHAIVSGYCGYEVAHVMDGLHLLDEWCDAMFGLPFADAPARQQDAVLRRLREAPHPKAVRFLAYLIRLTLAAFLCPPEHGGNRNGCGWKYVGYVPHPRSEGLMPSLRQDDIE